MTKYVCSHKCHLSKIKVAQCQPEYRLTPNWNVGSEQPEYSAHKSKETKKFLSTMPEHRFKFVFTPTHGSWLNLIESFFSKMTKQMLRGIRVDSKQELIDRIYQYFDEVNKEPVIYHWKYKMDEISEEEINGYK